MICEATKTCTSCGEPKSVTAFPPKRVQCRRCRQAYVQRWKRRRNYDFGEECRNDGHAATMRLYQKKQAWRTRKARWMIEQHGGNHLAAALEAYRRAESWREDRERGRGPGPKSEFRDVTAENVVDATVEDWKDRVRLLQTVWRMAKEGR